MTIIVPTPWQWQFPPIAKPPSFTVQLNKVCAEVCEVEDAFIFDTSRRIAEELMDTVHAAETALRMLEDRGVDLDAVKREVIEKNARRGYYGGAE